MQDFEPTIVSNVTFGPHVTSVVDFTTAKLHTSTPTQPPAIISTITSLVSAVLQTNPSTRCDDELASAVAE
jgi:hypothetical protein